MYTWNHRVVQKNDEVGFVKQYYEIHEVHYKNDDIVAMTDSAVIPYGETVEELAESLNMMLTACKHPVLIEDEIVYHTFDEDEDDDI